MRIVYVVENITGVGGLQRILIDKMNYLAEHTMHEIVLMTVWHADREPHFPISPAVRFVHLNVPRSIAFLPLALWRFRKRIRRLNPDVTIQLRAVGAFLTLFSGWHGPTIMEMHSARQAMNHRWLYPLVERRLDAIVCLTNGDARNYPNARRVEVIPNFSTLPPLGEGLGGASLRHVVWVGRDCPEKNLPRLRRIWAEIEKTHPDWTLDIHHNTSDIVGAYAKASISVLTSKAEGFSLTTLEAQQMGLPVVAFDCPYGPSDIVIDGETGYLIPLTVNGSEQEADRMFVEKLTYLMDHPEIRQKMGTAAQKASQRFNKERIMNQWLKLFAEIAK
ncbi:MAG: glycosyltransferase [Prevotella sp.]|nr:glycosyltransferase [Prevotella sp.]